MTKSIQILIAIAYTLFLSIRSHAAIYPENDNAALNKSWTQQNDELYSVIYPEVANQNAFTYLAKAVALSKAKHFTRIPGLLEKAKQQFLISLQETPNISAYNGLAKISLLQKNYQEANKWIDSAFRINPENLESRFLKARLLIAQQQQNKAIPILQDIIKEDSHFVMSYLTLATIYKSLKQPDKTVYILLQGKQVFQSDEKKLLLILTALAKHFVETGEQIKALKLAQSLYSRFPENIDALNLYLDTLLINQQREKAEDILKEKIRYNKKDIASKVKLISILIAKPNTKSEIIQLYQDIIRQYPKNPMFYIDLIHYLINKNDQVNAEKFISLTRKNFPKSNISEILSAEFLISQGKLRQAANLYRNAYKLQPNNNLLIKLTQTLLASQQKERAIEFLSHKKNSQKSITAQLLLAGIYLSDNKLNAAEREYRKILKINPKHFIALNDLAWLLFQKNSQNKEALTMAKQAYELAPNNRDVIDTYTTILRKQGFKDKANKIQRKN
jgi:tetratricopeptide (TPR) repeat protein